MCRDAGEKAQQALFSLCIALLGVSLDSTDYTLSVPRVSSGVFVVSGSEVGHLSGLRIERTKKRFFVESLAESGFCCNFANEFRRVVD